MGSGSRALVCNFYLGALKMEEKGKELKFCGFNFCLVLCEFVFGGFSDSEFLKV